MPLCYCPKGYVSEMVSTRRSKAIKEEETDITATWGQEKKETLKERFIKNKRILNPPYIYLKKEKQSKTKTTRRTFLMSQFNDDEEKETLLKRQKRQEDIAMRDNINLQ